MNLILFSVQVTNDGNITVSCMEPAGKNSFKWPEKEDVHCYCIKDVLCRIDAPTPVNRRGHYCLSKVDNRNDLIAMQNHNENL